MKKKMTLEQFLKTQRVDGKRLYKRFIKNLGVHGEDSNEYLKEECSSSRAISAAFNWSSSPERLHFWNLVNTKWENNLETD